MGIFHSVIRLLDDITEKEQVRDDYEESNYIFTFPHHNTPISSNNNNIRNRRQNSGLDFSSSFVDYSRRPNHRLHHDHDHVLDYLPSLLSLRDIIYREGINAGGIYNDGIGVDKCRWIKHHSSQQRILTVGEGDFSFSACLAMAFGSASNIVATSLDSHEFLGKNYRKALSNIRELRSRGSRVLHQIDATELTGNPSLGHLKFDRIIFNFPFAGFFKDLSRQLQLLRHMRLVSQFLKNAKEMIREDGEIHISHKTNGFHAEWKLEAIASSHRLKLIEAVQFNLADYPGYNTKYGFGGDNNFDCNPSKTYKFGLLSF